jgi:hypothetical protein
MEQAVRRLLLVLTLAGLLGACATSVHEQGAWIQDTLYFGLSRPAGVVTEAEWKNFVDTEVTPRFPDGLTQWQAQGQWRDAGRPVLHEDSRVLQIVHPADADSETKIQAIRSDYKKQFQQSSVLRVKSVVAADF